MRCLARRTASSLFYIDQSLGFGHQLGGPVVIIVLQGRLGRELEHVQPKRGFARMRQEIVDERTRSLG